MRRSDTPSHGSDCAGRGRARSLPDGSHAASLRRLAKLARLLDDRFALPGTSWRFGFDGLLGLVPGVGDAATTLLAAYIIVEARRHGVPATILGRMIANAGVDFAVGAIPVVGDLFDFGWKANRRNLELLLRHLDRGNRGATGSNDAAAHARREPYERIGCEREEGQITCPCGRRRSAGRVFRSRFPLTSAGTSVECRRWRQATTSNGRSFGRGTRKVPNEVWPDQNARYFDKM